MDSHQTKTIPAHSFGKFFRLNSIRSRLILVLAIFSIIPVAVTSLFINSISGNYARAKVQEGLQSISALKSSQVQKLGQRFTGQPFYRLLTKHPGVIDRHCKVRAGFT